MKADTDKIVAKFASAMAAVAFADPASIRKAAELIRGPSFDADPSDYRRSAINAYAGFLERAAQQQEDAIRAAYQRNADHIDGYDRDDLGESPDY